MDSHVTGGMQGRREAMGGWSESNMFVLQGGQKRDEEKHLWL